MIHKNAINWQRKFPENLEFNFFLRDVWDLYLLAFVPFRHVLRKKTNKVVDELEKQGVEGQSNFDE